MTFAEWLMFMAFCFVWPAIFAVIGCLFTRG